MLTNEAIIGIAQGKPTFSIATLKKVDQPKLLDLYCGAGCGGRGYQRAGFYVVGIDYKWKKYAGNMFLKTNAISWLRENMQVVRDNFQIIHASPECQCFTKYRNCTPDTVLRATNDIPIIRELLEETGLPYIIENVEGAPLKNPIKLCGSSFGLGVRRHRLFESNLPLEGLPCDHESQRKNGKRYPGNSQISARYTCEIGSARSTMAVQLEAMGVDWPVKRWDLTLAIPPAYTKYLGRQCLTLIT